MDAAVVIVTRNRRDHALRAVKSAVAQNGNYEIILIDDGSSDGTGTAVCAQFPSVRYVRYDEHAGYVIRRNQAARLTSAPVIVSIDDDAVFTTSTVVARTLIDLEHPRVGAVAIPYIDVGSGRPEQQRAPDSNGCWATATFRGTAYAVKRELFLSLGGFREAIVHQGEEADYCLRMLAAGHVVRLGRSDQVQHFMTGESRDVARMDLYGQRNVLLHSFTYFPFPENLVLMAGHSVKSMKVGFELRRPLSMLRGLAHGVAACWEFRHDRNVLPRTTLRLDRRLRRRRHLLVARLEGSLQSILQ